MKFKAPKNMSASVIAVAERYFDRFRYTKGGAEIMASCPLPGHDETKPSFSINVDTGLFYCFGCEGKGGLRKLLKDMGLSKTIQDRYAPAGKSRRSWTPSSFVAGKIRVRRHVGPDGTPQSDYLEPTLQEDTGDLLPIRPHRPQSADYLIPEAHLGLYDRCPKYMLDRGLEKWVLRDYDIGFDELENRVTAPIRNVDGQLVGFMGRSIDLQNESKWKYKVYTKELEKRYPGYFIRKSHHLWNLHNVTQLDDIPFVVLVEGFVDALWCIQCGINEVVALLGKKASRRHAELLRNLGVPVVLLLDNDPAGEEGTRTLVHSLKGLEVLVTSYPDSVEQEDPVGVNPDILASMVIGAKPSGRLRLSARKRRNPWLH